MNLQRHPLKTSSSALVFLLGLGLLGSCCPQVVQSPPQVITRVDTLTVVLPPPPPIIIPADSTQVVLDVHLLCDSLWRTHNPVVIPPVRSPRLSASAQISQQQVKFTCREDSLLVLLDSIRTYAVHRGETQTIHYTYYKCPYAWPRWVHLVVVIGFVLCLLLTLLLTLKRLR